MKRPLTIAAITLLTILFVYACSSTIRTAKTSFVTITIGGNSQKAALHAEGATPWARFKYFLADAKLMPEAYAYIPSVVQVLVVTVSAADMTAPIVGIDSIKPDQTTSTIRIEVPNGTGRQFTVEGIRGVDSNTYYRGTAAADLNGIDVSLDISMAFVGPGIYVDPAGIDQTGCGTQASPCMTITYALTSRTSGTDAIIVSAGTYTAGESYPLQLQPGTALICMGTAYSTILDSDSSGSDTVYGNDGASVDNCKIIPGCDWVGIDDTIGGSGTLGTPTKMKINGVAIDSNASCPAWDAIILSADSTVIETTVLDAWSTYITVKSGKPVIKANSLVGSVNATDGVYIAAGNPLIEGNTISGMGGNGIIVFDGDPTISANTIVSNSIGLNIQSPGKPLVSGTLFDNNNTGLSISAGNAEVRSSTFTNNGTGIDISGGSPRIQTNEITNNSGAGINVNGGTTPLIQSNRIHCNYNLNLSTSATATIDLRNNSWESAPPIVNDTLTGCNQGADICYDYLGPVPEYQPYGAAAAAPGSCVRVIAKPK